ncbi:MAG: hypothetical protein PHF00_05515 [Elusimicrobia bacterium]|nr:hypothetical protein [Elusimicrobiota bacterium]
MEILIAVCLAVLVVEISVLVAVAVVTLLQLRRAARAVEVLAYRVDVQVAAFERTLHSGWMQFVQGLVAILTRFLTEKR